MVLIVTLSGSLAAMTWRVPRLRMEKTLFWTPRCRWKYVKQSVADSLQEAILQLGFRAGGKPHRTIINLHITKCDI